MPISQCILKIYTIVLCLFLAAQFEFSQAQAMETSAGDIILEVDARRFFTEEEWAKAVAIDPKTPWNFYGKETFQQWIKGLQFINANANGMALGLELYDFIEKVVLEGHYYKKFEIRRIHQAYQKSHITEKKRDELLIQIERGEKIYFSGIDHKTIPGRFRWDSLDEFIHEGESIDSSGNRYFTARELDLAELNPLLKVDYSKIKKVHDNFFVGQIDYPRIKDIQKLTINTLEEAKIGLNKNLSKREAILIINEMFQRLMTIHRSVDGNGRTLRLLRDLLYMRIGVPPPLHIIENDIFLTNDKTLNLRLMEQMQNYERVRKEYLKTTEPPIPSHLFYWSSPGTWKWMVENNRNPTMVPMQTIPSNSHITKGRSQLIDQFATFAWSNPVGALRGGTYADGTIEYYAKSGPKGEAPNLLSMKITKNPRVLRLRTLVHTSPIADQELNYKEYDLIYHEAIDESGNLVYKEWVILRAYPKIPDARKAIMAQAMCRNAS